MTTTMMCSCACEEAALLAKTALIEFSQKHLIKRVPNIVTGCGNCCLAWHALVIITQSVEAISSAYSIWTL